ncbi:MAG: ohrR [Akkermansiaceae bacterium]|nr:ohrR [Akkermansiaceae bacterium]
MPLDRLVCLDLYSTSRAVIKAYRPFLEKLGLTYPQYLVMMALWEAGPLGVKDLAKKLALDSGTLSPLLKRLEVAGLVSRTRSKEDEREVSIALTAPGAALQKQSLVVCQNMFPLFGMGEADVITLQQTLRGIRERMDEADEPA